MSSRGQVHLRLAEDHDGLLSVAGRDGWATEIKLLGGGSQQVSEKMFDFDRVQSRKTDFGSSTLCPCAATAGSHSLRRNGAF